MSGEDKNDVKIKVGFVKDLAGIYATSYSTSNVVNVFHTVEVVIPWYVFPNDKLDLKKPLQYRRRSNTDEWKDVKKFEVSPEGNFYLGVGNELDECLTSYEILNFVRNKPDIDHTNKIVNVDGQKYKLVQVEDE